jgi:uncharacterized protein YggE
MPKLALAAVAAAMLLVPAAAQAQAPPTLTTIGIGEADVTPADRNDDASIKAAVADATAKALPLAIADAKTRASALAAAAGLTLGGMTAISDAGQNGYFGPSFLSQGTFGNGHFCGQIPNRKTVVRDGRRRSVRVKGTHRVCRVPREVYSTVTLTFATS